MWRNANPDAEASGPRSVIWLPTFEKQQTKIYKGGFKEYC